MERTFEDIWIALEEQVHELATLVLHNVNFSGPLLEGVPPAEAEVVLYGVDESSNKVHVVGTKLVLRRQVVPWASEPR